MTGFGVENEGRYRPKGGKKVTVKRNNPTSSVPSSLTTQAVMSCANRYTLSFQTFGDVSLFNRADRARGGAGRTTNRSVQKPVRIMAAPLVGGVVGTAVAGARQRAVVVGPGDKKDKAPLLGRDQARLPLRLPTLRMAAERCGP